MVRAGAIDPQLRHDIPLCLAKAFAVRPGYPFLDALIEMQYSRPPYITGVAIKATDHEWRRAPNGVELVPEYSAGSGLHFNGRGFEVACPVCRQSIDIGQPGSEPLYKGLDAWRLDRDGASIACSACERASPIRQWRSNTNRFAIGHLAIELWGGHVLALTEQPQSPSAIALRRLLGDDRCDYEVVYSHI
jgi:hypothetical protein